MDETTLATIIAHIKEEITIDENGMGRASIRAVARLADIADSSLVRAFQSAALKPSELAKILTNHGFDGAAQKDWSVLGIPDIAIGSASAEGNRLNS